MTANYFPEWNIKSYKISWLKVLRVRLFGSKISDGNYYYKGKFYQFTEHPSAEEISKYEQYLKEQHEEEPKK